MSASIFETVESIAIDPNLVDHLAKLRISKHDLEEVMLNFPIVKIITVHFSDGYQRYYAEGVSDTGKRLGIVFYIHKKHVIATVVQKL